MFYQFHGNYTPVNEYVLDTYKQVNYIFYLKEFKLKKNVKIIPFHKLLQTQSKNSWNIKSISGCYLQMFSIMLLLFVNGNSGLFLTNPPTHIKLYSS